MERQTSITSALDAGDRAHRSPAGRECRPPATGGAPAAAPSQAFARRALVMALVLCAAGVPMLPTNPMKVAGTLLAGCVLLIGGCVALRSGESLRRSPLDAPVVIFGALAVLATVLGVHPRASFLPSPARGDGLLDYFVFLPMALGAARLSGLEVREVLAVLLGAGALIGAAGTGQFYGFDATRWIGNAPFDYGFRSWGTLANPDFLGGYAALVLPIGLAIAAGAHELHRRRWAAAASILLYAALVGSQTRSAWAASGLATVILLSRLPRSAQVYRRLALLGLAFAAITTIMTATQPDVSLGARARSAVNPLDSSMQGKLWIWRHVLPMIRERPVLGWGFSAVAGHLPGIGAPDYHRVFGDASVLIDVAHNDILQVAVNMGLAGLAAYLWIWAVALGAARSAARRPASSLGAESAGVFAGLAAYAVWLQFLWSHIGNANVFWVLTGIAVALSRLEAPALTEGEYVRGPE